MSISRSFWLSCLVLTLNALIHLPAQAVQCPPGNLLAGKLALEANGDPSPVRITDGEVVSEGGQWDAPQALELSGVEAVLTFDLGAEYPLRTLLLQADANDSYRVAGSRDGLAFQPLWDVAPVAGHGQRFRAIGNLQAEALRYVRLHPISGDGAYAVTELQASCEQPFSAQIKVIAIAQQEVEDEPPTPWRWDNDSSARWQLALALLALVLCGWRWFTRLHKGARRWADGGLAVLALVAFLTYFNFGAFHFPNYIHTWDSYHYYIGGKYFPELGYDGLYDCTAIADAESGLTERVLARRQTNLRTNSLESAAEVLADPERCLQRFGAERWQSFKDDLGVFRAREEPARWDNFTTDHGFNATPVWTLLGTTLANLAPLTERNLLLLTALDPLFLLGASLLLGWAFGWRVMALSLAIFACYFPARFYWTGGSFLRWDWLFWGVASVCLMRKQFPLLSGMALAYAALLRIFPGFLALGLLVALLYRRWKYRQWDRAGLRFLAGMLLVTLLLSGLSEGLLQRPDSHRAFISNTLKHESTPLTNNMGLRTVLAYRPGETGLELFDAASPAPWKAWQDARRAAFVEAKPLYWLIVLGWLGLLVWAVRAQPLWVALALGATFIPIAVDLTSYYYAFVLMLAPLCARAPWVAIWLLGLSAASQFVAWAPLPGMPTWFDMQFTLISLLTLLVFLGLLLMVGRATRPDQC
ncbi:MAG: hypothetical protein V4812_00165 [Pseudomonadota bacterium]